MNKHQNKNKQMKKVAANLAVEERDCVPIELSRSMLTSPGVQLSNRMRKNCMESFSSFFVSTREPKPFAARFAEKAKKASAAQLAKWAQRTVVKRLQVTRAYYTLKTKLAKLDPMKVHDIARGNLALQSMDVEANRLDTWMQALRTEAESRLLKSHADKI